MKKKAISYTENKNWSTVEYCSYGVLEPLVNVKKDYTLLYKADAYPKYCVAYAYNKQTNTWGQGHYFDNIYEALGFMFEHPKTEYFYENITNAELAKAKQLLLNASESGDTAYAWDFVDYCKNNIFNLKA